MFRGELPSSFLMRHHVRKSCFCFLFYSSLPARFAVPLNFAHEIDLNAP
ncbi:hypothetical protein RMSM_07084 [Rhodopirellula maiorica SM1]|uniref:Uncharacterized protein n=1 Tax=Rhodopirellula maiorica SM1 TaxID=1265738 RepID=M5R8Z7_9BACT|nr:hypothetical protein RMSM_07084 [Rhodopirellula maiorica SM1]